MARRTDSSQDRSKYIPALTFRRLTPLYDPLIRWTMREGRFKRRLVEQARIERHHRVFDLGCGTATLTLLVKQAHPEAEVVGLDGDPDILEIARAKIGSAGLEIALDQGMAFDPPYPDASFDRILSSLLFHHLTREDKVHTTREVFRVLRPGGELHVADFGKPRTAMMHLVSLVMRRLEETARYSTLFGPLGLYRARKPG